MKKDHLYIALVFYILGLCVVSLLGEILVTLKRNKYIVLEVTKSEKENASE